MSVRPASHYSPAIGIAAELAQVKADRDHWRARALAAEAACSVSASARRLRSLRTVRKAPVRRERHVVEWPARV